MKQLIHLNNNLLCAVDVETTGLDPTKHDIIQICVLPLDNQIQPIIENNIKPFYTYLQPRRPENIDVRAMSVHGLDITDIMLGLDPYKAAELLEEWFLNLGLPERKKIAPLGQNYPFDRGFLLDWLGPQTYNFIFDYHIRDTATCALFLNDVSAFDIDYTPPFPKINLKYLASQLRIPTERSHDAFQDCITVAKVYKAMLAMALPIQK